MKKLIKKIVQFLANAYAGMFLFKAKLKRKKKVKRVVFICQYIPAWNKFKPVYDELKQRGEFEPILLCVPDRIENCELTDKESIENETYAYFKENGYECVNALVGKNEWLSLKKLKPDYVFYPRPYRLFMPKAYSPIKVMRYSKICHIMYGMGFAKEDMNVSIGKAFFRYVYCYFAESQEALEINYNHFKLSHKLRLRKTVYLGVPAFCGIMQAQNESTDNWNFARDAFKAMWTPRWTTDLSLGGSNFFTFKQGLLDYAKAHPDVAFLFRPHPLMFGNFIKTGEMTQAEVDAYKSECAKLSNVKFDGNAEYIDSFWASDLLITDISGVLPEYFITGKPVVFCALNMTLELAEHTAKIIEGCYVVRSMEELAAVLDALKAGDDPLKACRKQIVEELFCDTLYNSPKLIANFL